MDLPGGAEVVVGFDGPDPEGAARAGEVWRGAGGDPGRLRVFEYPREGYIAVRARAVAEVLEGEIYLSLNDDVRPEPGFLRAHAEAHRAAPGPRVVVGDSRFLPVPAPRVVDLLVARTGVVFFWHDLLGTGDGHAPGFRHAYGLNLSVPLALVRAARAVPRLVGTYGYDDLLLAWHLLRDGAALRFLPEARAPHDHRYEPGDLVTRERSLGVAAARYAAVEPGFTRDLFGDDILAAPYLAWCREWCRRERAAAQRAAARFLRLGAASVEILGPDPADDVLQAIADALLPARRLAWREGLLAEVDGADGHEVRPAPLVVEAEGRAAARGA